jgi:hypothetical protein
MVAKHAVHRSDASLASHAAFHLGHEVRPQGDTLRIPMQRPGIGVTDHVDYHVLRDHRTISTPDNSFGCAMNACDESGVVKLSHQQRADL